MASKYYEVLTKVYGGTDGVKLAVPSVLLCIDPGETTGFAVFMNGVLCEYGQIETVSTDAKGDKKIQWGSLADLFIQFEPDVVVCENYRIYAHKLERHSFSQVETLRLIGGIDQLCNSPYLAESVTPLYYAMAVQAKGFVTDDRLKEWDLWKSGMKHSRDAIRHGIYFLLITNRPKGGK